MNSDFFLKLYMKEKEHLIEQELEYVTDTKIFFLKNQKNEKERKNLPYSALPLKYPQQLDWMRLKPGAQTSFWVSHKDNKVLASMCIGKNLESEWLQDLILGSVTWIWSRQLLSESVGQTLIHLLQNFKKRICRN